MNPTLPTPTPPTPGSDDDLKALIDKLMDLHPAHEKLAALMQEYIENEAQFRSNLIFADQYQRTRNRIRWAVEELFRLA